MHSRGRGSARMKASIVSEQAATDETVGEAARRAGPAALAALLQTTRTRTLRLLDAYEAALGPALAVPRSPELNPPLWELGHIAWFTDRWIARHPGRNRGAQADPEHPLHPARQAARGLDADALYDSSAVPHAKRWSLPLPTLDQTRADLQASLDDTLALLARADDHDDALYFFRLALFHEDMHAEAWVYMAQTLGIALPAEHLPPAPAAPRPPLRLPAQTWRLGRPGRGFAFDNELPGASVALAAFEIDAQPVHWARYLPAVDAGAVPVPRHLRRAGGQWQRHRHGVWQPLDPMAPACHLSAAEARAWCDWAGRRLPSEAEWECAALGAPGFAWGQVWEWTSSPFAPFPGFVAHPYRDYSRPWFDGRPVLKGASHATAAHLRHPRYRNFFSAERNDLFAGFRSAAGF